MKSILRILGIIAAIVGIIISANMISAADKVSIPDKYVFVSSSSSAYDYGWGMNTGAKYLGGDAYNYIVEASLKAGYYNACVMKQTVMRTGGTALLFASIFFLFFSAYSLEKALNAGKQEKLLLDIENKKKDFQSFVLQHLQKIEDNTVQKKIQTEEKEPENKEPENKELQNEEPENKEPEKEENTEV